MATELGWAIDFIDKPADGLDFNFWSGTGNLTLQIDGEAIEYKGANGVISLTPPREEAATATKMTAVIDASDPSIRQLRTMRLMTRSTRFSGRPAPRSR